MMNKKIIKINSKENNIKMMEDCTGKLKPYYQYMQNDKSIMVEQKTNLNELIVFKKVFSSINFSNNNPNCREILLKKTDIIKCLYPLAKTEAHNISEGYDEKCKNFLIEVMETEVIIEDKNEYLYTNLFSYIEWEKYTDIVKIAFSESIEPYILNLQKKIIQHEGNSLKK